MKRLLLLVPVVAALAGCSSFYAEADQPMACVTLPQQTFSIMVGQGPIVGPYDGDAAWTISFGLGQALPDILVSGSPNDHVLHILSLGAALQPDPGVNFNWLSNLQLTVIPATGAPVSVASHPGGFPAGTLSFNLNSANTNYNLISALQSGNLQIEFAGHVSVPAGQTIPSQWTASFNTCLEAHVKKTLEELIKG